MKAEAIFLAAVEKSSPSERAAYLDQVCGDNAGLRRWVEGLLRSHEQGGSFLEGALFEPRPTIGDVPRIEGPGSRVGPYKLLERIGEGGMGVVYMAEQTQPVRRKVALKLIKPGMDTKQVIARFEAERQALALMDHPNIARILDAGATESGHPYFVMELVRGIPITEYCDRNRLAIDDRLDLFALVCQAVHHAHQKGVIHRDLKPSNVLITLHDGTPVPKIIDFGIAKATGQQSLTDKTLYTGFAELIGTPMYISPEQAELSGIDIDTRSDVYSLGVLLYELLTSTTPFDQETLRRAALDEIRRIIREEEPPRPSTRLGKDAPTTLSRSRASSFILHPSSFQELDWVTMKALEKDRRRRYDTAGAFAADIARYLRHQPVEAGPPSAWYRGRKFARRHRLALAMAAIVVLSAGVIVGMWAWSAGRLDRVRRAIEVSRTEIQRRAIESRHHRYAADIRQANELVQNGQGLGALALLNKWQPAPGKADERNFAWYYLLRLCHDERRTLRGHKGDVYHAEFSRDGRTLVTCGQDGTVRFWEVATGRPLPTILAHATEVNGAAFSPDGRTLATVSDDGTIRLWDAETAAAQATIRAHQGEATAVRFTPDGRRLISAGRNDCLVKLWDMATLQEVASTPPAHQGFIENLALAPTGTTLATADSNGSARLWNLADLSLGKSLHVALQEPVFGLAFSADGTRLATADGGGRVRMWDLPSGEPREEFQGFAHANDARAVAFLAGDRMVVSADGHAVLRLTDATTGTSLATLNGHTGKIWGISVSPDGTTFATVSRDGTVKLWDGRLPQRWLAIRVPSAEGPLAFTPDGRTLIVADYKVDATQELSGFDPKTGARRFHRILERGPTINAAGLSADGAIALFRRTDFTVTAWEVATGTRLATVDPPLIFDGSEFVPVHRPGRPIELVDANTGRRRALRGTESAAYLARSREAQVVALLVGGELAIWDRATNRVGRRGHGMPHALSVARFSPDATILATSQVVPFGPIALWDVNSLELLDSLPGHTAVVSVLDFSPDGRVLASLSSDGVVKLWDVAARVELLTLQGPFRAWSAIRFTPDGRTLAFRAVADGKPWVYLIPTELPEDLTSEEGP